MSRAPVTFRGSVFDGRDLRDGCALRFEDGVLSAMDPEGAPQANGVIDLGKDIIAPGYVDLQVNGGGGVMLNDAPSVETLRSIAAAHRRQGVTAMLPTLITDTPAKTREAIAASIAAVREGVPGIAGLHLEGPHLSVARKGAHDASLIRPMEEDDLLRLETAARDLPVLKVTVAPENVTQEQVHRLAKAGVLVSLGHTDADFETCRRYFNAGAACVTHLFNAMSQLGSRQPGLVGACLSDPNVYGGLIADGVHVHPASIRAAWDAKRTADRFFLVSDAMAVAGTDATSFTLNGLTIRRSGGRLTLPDGTLAGADLDLTSAVRTMVGAAGIPLDAALRGATHVPARLIGWPDYGLKIGETRISDPIRISADLTGVASLE